MMNPNWFAFTPKLLSLLGSTVSTMPLEGRQMSTSSRRSRQVIDDCLTYCWNEHESMRGASPWNKLHQLCAVSERPIVDVGYALWDDDAGQVGAVVKRGIPDAGDAIGNCDVRQSVAPSERPVPEAGYAVGDRDARQADAALECTIPNVGDAVGNRYVIRLLQRRMHNPRCW